MARSSTVDTDAARELELYIDNDARLYAQKDAFLKNVHAKMRRGTYDPTAAVKLWMYYVDRGAKAYAKEFDREANWSRVFDRATREHVAARYAKEEHAMIQRGEYTKYPPVHAKSAARDTSRARQARRHGSAPPKNEAMSREDRRSDSARYARAYGSSRDTSRRAKRQRDASSREPLRAGYTVSWRHSAGNPNLQWYLRSPTKKIVAFGHARSDSDAIAMAKAALSAETSKHGHGSRRSRGYGYTTTNEHRMNRRDARRRTTPKRRRRDL